MATLLVKGFSAVRPKNHSELHSARKSDSLLRAGCHDQWDIFEVRPDHAPLGYMEGPMTKDIPRPSLPDRPNACDRYMTFIFHVPSISIGIKNFIEQQAELWPECGKEMLQRHEGREQPEPIDRTRRSFYWDFNSLPDHAKASLLSQGNCTLNEMDARAALRHKFDQTLVNKCFVEFAIDG